MLKKMVMPGEWIAGEEFEDTGDTDSVESYPDTTSTEYSDISTADYNAPPPGTAQPDPSIPRSPHTRSGKDKKTKKDREHFYKGCGVVYLPGDINVFAKKLH